MSRHRSLFGTFLVVLALAGCQKLRGDAQPAGDGGPGAAPSRAPTPIADSFRDVSAKILAAGRANSGAYAKLAYLADHIGHRIAGSPRLDRAIAWAQEAMHRDGHESVHAEKVMVSSWERGEIALQVVSPEPQTLSAIALGLSPGTPSTGVTAPLVVVDSFAALEALGEAKVKGHIVLFNHVMPPYTRDAGSGYGDASKIRVRGPAAAAKLGAVAALTRSATARSLRSPHTGVTVFDEGQPSVPAAALATEDSAMLARLAAQGPVTLHLVLTAKNLPKVPSANVIGELRGRELPAEIVLLGAHLDSWDVGQGAQDDGAGCATMMEAISILRSAGLRPRRTIRVVLFTNEEHGTDGANAYAKDHENELADHVAAIESDGGSFEPVGLSYEGKVEDPAYKRLVDLITLLEPLGATKLTVGHSGTDLGPLGDAVPRMSRVTNGETYFDYHHTEADTLDKVDPVLLRDNATMMAIVAYALAEMPDRLGK